VLMTRPFLPTHNEDRELPHSTSSPTPPRVGGEIFILDDLVPTHEF
jgi:hypothetical protein